MTARVRFSNGQVVQYNGASKIEHAAGGQTILKDQNSFIIATIPAGADCAVEFVHPCSVTWPGKDLEGMVKTIKELGRETCTYSDSHHLAELKKYLEGFDARRRCWK